MSSTGIRYKIFDKKFPKIETLLFSAKAIFTANPLISQELSVCN